MLEEKRKFLGDIGYLASVRNNSEINSKYKEFKEKPLNEKIRIAENREEELKKLKKSHEIENKQGLVELYESSLVRIQKILDELNKEKT